MFVSTELKYFTVTKFISETVIFFLDKMIRVSKINKDELYVLIHKCVFKT